MRLRTLEEAMRVAAAMRQLRDVEMGDARRYRAMCDRCVDPEAREVLSGYVRDLAAVARKWNRQMLIAQRAIRTLLASRRRAVA